jgi:hypothetical protein
VRGIAVVDGGQSEHRRRERHRLPDRHAPAARLRRKCGESSGRPRTCRRNRAVTERHGQRQCAVRYCSLIWPRPGAGSGQAAEE